MMSSKFTRTRTRDYWDCVDCQVSKTGDRAAVGNTEEDRIERPDGEAWQKIREDSADVYQSKRWHDNHCG